MFSLKQYCIKNNVATKTTITLADTSKVALVGLPVKETSDGLAALADARFDNVKARVALQAETIEGRSVKASATLPPVQAAEVIRAEYGIEKPKAGKNRLQDKDLNGKVEGEPVKS